jgi:hypothetical protein
VYDNQKKDIANNSMELKSGILQDGSNQAGLISGLGTRQGANISQILS